MNNEYERRDFERTKAMVESVQMLYNIIDQYATLDLARSGMSRYTRFEKTTLGNLIKQSLNAKNMKEIAKQTAKDLANIFNRKNGTS